MALMMTHKQVVAAIAIPLLLILACILDHAADGKTKAREAASALRTWWVFAIFLSMVVLFATIGARYAQARDPDGRYAASPLKEWFDHLQSGKGLCCSDADGTAISDADWESRDGHYRVRIDVSREAGKVDMQWLDVPDDAVITEPNRVGRTMVWPLRGYLGTTIRCFMPGPMT